MLISDTTTGAINQQIGNDLGDSLQYVATSAHFTLEAMPELAGLFRTLSEARRESGMRSVQHLTEAGARLEIASLPMPQNEFKSAEEAVQLALDAEIKNRDGLTELVELSIKESDHVTHRFVVALLSEAFSRASHLSGLLKVVQRAGEAGLPHVETHLSAQSRKQL